MNIDIELVFEVCSYCGNLVETKGRISLKCPKLQNPFIAYYSEEFQKEKALKILKENITKKILKQNLCSLVFEHSVLKK